jgi:hypothetical protein
VSYNAAQTAIDFAPPFLACFLQHTNLQEA